MRMDGSRSLIDLRRQLHHDSSLEPSFHRRRRRLDAPSSTPADNITRHQFVINETIADILPQNMNLTTAFSLLVYTSLSGMAKAYLAADCQMVSLSAAFCHIKDMSCQTDLQQLETGVLHSAGPKLWNSLPADL